MKIIEYKAILHLDSNLLVEDINKALAEGWELYGHLIIDSHNLKLQPMVKYAAAPPYPFIYHQQDQNLPLTTGLIFQ